MGSRQAGRAGPVDKACLPPTLPCSKKRSLLVVQYDLIERIQRALQFFNRRRFFSHERPDSTDDCTRLPSLSDGGLAVSAVLGPRCTDSLDALSSERAGGHTSVCSATAYFMAADRLGVALRLFAPQRGALPPVSRAPASLNQPRPVRRLARGSRGYFRTSPMLTPLPFTPPAAYACLETAACNRCSRARSYCR
jgi:hypothetical protein